MSCLGTRFASASRARGGVALVRVREAGRVCFMPKILIVEDAQDQLELFAKSFRRAGFDVYGAHDGGHAMDRVRDIRPDIILLDQMMPEVDGITFLQNLR